MISETSERDSAAPADGRLPSGAREAVEMHATSKTRVLRLLTAGWLLASLLPAAATPGAAQPNSGSPCTGDPNADYNGPCGPSVTVPAWSDAVGWDSSYLADTITLFDLDGDGTDELIGRGPHGLLVNTWSDDWGQWVPASELKVPLPFPGPGTAADDLLPGTLRFGQLAEGVWGVVGLGGNGLETWSWDPSDGSPASGVWTLESSSGPFAITGVDWTDPAPYASTIQFVPEPLGGASYGVIGRTADGIQFCAWDQTGKDWSCNKANGVFNDDVMFAPDGSLAPYYYGTIQFGDIYPGTPGPELIGRDNQGGGVLKVYSWDDSSQSFTELEPSGPWPFWSPDGVAWDDVSQSSTIQPVQLAGEGQPMQVIGRSADGLRWFGIRDSGCGDAAPPCWQDLTTPQNTPLSDADGYDGPQAYETIRFIDLDRDGVDEVLARDPGSDIGSKTAPGTIVMWSFEAGTGWVPLNRYSIEMTAGPAADPLWSQPSYYGTIRVGTVTEDQRAALIARGKYGVRTWQYWEEAGWNRPYPLGFPKPEQDAYDLINQYLGLAAGRTVRDSYTQTTSGNMLAYRGCLETSLNKTNWGTVPTHPCNSDSKLSNKKGVTWDQWQSLASQLAEELSYAEAVTNHFNKEVTTVFNNLFFQDKADFDTALDKLFPDVPDNDEEVTAQKFNFIVGVVKAVAWLTDPIAGAALSAFGSGLAAMEIAQTANNSANTFSLRVGEVQYHMDAMMSAAQSRNTDVFQYVAMDRGLQALYGNMILNEYWQIDGPQQNSAISAGSYSNAKWTYQTMVPLYWQVWVCETAGDECGSGGLDVDRTSDNSFLISKDGDNSWWSVIANHKGDQISTSNTLYSRVFGAVPPQCEIGGSSTSSNWTFGEQGGAPCTLGISPSDVLSFEGGWDQLACWVYQPPNFGQTRNYRCGEGPPDGYGPPPN